MADSKWYSILTWSIRHVAYNLICGFLFASGLPITLRKTATKERKIGRQKERLLKSFIKNYWNAIKNMNPSISPIENKMAMVINSHYPVPFTLKQNVYTTIWAYRDYRDQNIYSPKNHFWISDGYLVAFRWIVLHAVSENPKHSQSERSQANTRRLSPVYFGVRVLL